MRKTPARPGELNGRTGATRATAAGDFVLRLDLVRRHAAFARPRRVWIGPQAGDR
ncbi:MAG TPA: hypothetical protein VKE94_18590 [Gemmataceae bacterium]|nr:hypothetical protein [Gemmataceae bacterium]